MKMHLFGATSPPGCASYGFKYMASQEKEAYLQRQFITRDFYVDDRLPCIESTEQAKDLIPGACEICKKGSLRLHKFIANDRKVLESVPEMRELCFGFTIVLKDQPLTRRVT